MSEEECDTYFEIEESVLFTENDAIKMINKSDIVIHQVFNKQLVVAVKLPNGFVMIESSGSLSPKDFSRSDAYSQCIKRIRERIMRAEEYRLLQGMYANE